VLCGEPGEQIVAGDARDVVGVAAAISAASSGKASVCRACLSGAVPSPCISLCTLDAAGQSCRGCGRSVVEITGWRDMAAAQRAAVLLRLRASR
tara:strand:- start:562 stop:843 length:282 start_codon:yes stop_codon:yes gene_type:complete